MWWQLLKQIPSKIIVKKTVLVHSISQLNKIRNVLHLLLLHWLLVVEVLEQRKEIVKTFLIEFLCIVKDTFQDFKKLIH